MTDAKFNNQYWLLCVFNFHIRWWSLPAWWEVGGESQWGTRVKRYNRSHFLHNLLFWVLWLMMLPRQWSHLCRQQIINKCWFLGTHMNLMIVLYVCDSFAPRPLLLLLFTVWVDCKQSQELIKNWDQNPCTYSQIQTTILESRSPFTNPRPILETSVIYVMYLLLLQCKNPLFNIKKTFTALIRKPCTKWISLWDIFPWRHVIHYSIKVVLMSQPKLEPTFHAHLSKS